MKKIYFLFLLIFALKNIQAQSNLTFAVRQGDFMQISIDNFNNTNTGVVNPNAPVYGNLLRFNNLAGNTCTVNMIIYFQTGSNNVATIKHTAAITLIQNMEINYFITVGFVNGQAQVIFNEANRSTICNPNWSTGNGNNNNNNNNNPNYNPNCRATIQNPLINKIDFDNLKNEVNKEAFSDAKMKLLKRVIRGYNIMTTDVANLVSIFAFDDDKLDLIFYLYDYTCDTQNYYSLRNAVVFSSSKEQIDQFLDKKK